MKPGKRNRQTSVVQRMDLKGRTEHLILEVKNQNLIIDYEGNGRISQLGWLMEFRFLGCG